MSQEKMLELVESGIAATVKTEAELSEEGRRRIISIVRDFAYDSWVTGSQTYDMDYDAILDSTKMVNGNGKIAKRIRRNLRRLYNLALPDNLISDIGNLAANYTLPADDYYIEFTSDCLGTVGKFGDDRCCFRKGGEYHYHCIALHHDSNCGAVRIYNGSGNGIARSWYFQSPDDQAICLFNSYGLRLNKIAELVEMTGNYGTARIGSVGAEIYLNSNGESYIFNGSQNYYFVSADPESEHYEICADCNNTIDPDCDSYYWIGDSIYCCDCAGNCQHCEENYANEYTTWSQVMRPHSFNYGIEEITVCDDCLSDHYAECENCGNFWEAEQMHNIEYDGTFYCENCEDLVTECEDCQDTILVTECADQTFPLCEDCQVEFDSKFTPCQNCQISPFDECADCYSRAIMDRANLAHSNSSQTFPLLVLIADLAVIRQRKDRAILAVCKDRANELHSAQLRRNLGSELTAHNLIVHEITLCQI